MSGANVAVRWARPLVWRLRNWRALTTLRRHEHPSSGALGDAVGAVVTASLTPEEHAWVERIESLRSDLSASAREVEVTDYGAGTPGTSASAPTSGPTIRTRTVGEICSSDPQPLTWCVLLFKLVRRLRPSVCLELGTSLGISAAYQAAALAMNGRGRLVTIEGAASVAALARENLEGLGLGNAEVVVGAFESTLEGVLQREDGVDFAFVDGEHERDATIGYFEQLLPHLPEGGTLVFDDIRWTPGMQEAWETVRDDGRVRVAVDLWKCGICVVDDSVVPKLVTSLRVNAEEVARGLAISP